MNITAEQYRHAQQRIEELLPQVPDDMPANEPAAAELVAMSDIVVEYETQHFPIPRPTVAEVIKLSLQEHGMTQKNLAARIGVSPTRVSHYLSGKAEPTLKVAHKICSTLNISPATMLGF